VSSSSSFFLGAALSTFAAVWAAVQLSTGGFLGGFVAPVDCSFIREVVDADLEDDFATPYLSSADAALVVFGGLMSSAKRAQTSARCLRGGTQTIVFLLSRIVSVNVAAIGNNTDRP
jgi:hypothetical protein